MIDRLTNFLLNELNLIPVIDQTTLNFLDYSSPDNIYSDIGIYSFENSNQRQAIEYKIKEEVGLAMHKPINETLIASSMKFNFKYEGKKQGELKFHFVSKIIPFGTELQVNRAIFPECVLN
jgi:hypothetical protein